MYIYIDVYMCIDLYIYVRTIRMYRYVCIDIYIHTYRYYYVTTASLLLHSIVLLLLWN